MIRRLVEHAGLAKPYRFERTLCILVALSLALVVGASALWLDHRGKLHSETQLEWHFFYLATLIVLGFVLARVPWLAAIFLSLASLEIAFGLGSAALYKFHVPIWVALPADESFYVTFAYHPLLHGVLIPVTPGSDHPLPITNNAQGLRGPERTPEMLRERTVIAVFGGSSAYDPGSPDGQSWSERLEALLGKERYAVLNHGVSGYTTVEAVIQTAFYQSSYGVAPRCAIYYEGWNDARNSHLRGLDPAYADYHLPSMVDALQSRRIGGPVLAISPVLTLLGRLAVFAFDTVQPASPEGEASAAPDPALEEIYARNIGTISAINRGRGIRTIWVGQIMNRAELARDRDDSWMPFLRYKDAWPAIERLNRVARREAERLGDVYVDIPIDAFGPDDFRDIGHFRPQGSLKFASLLAPAVAEACH
jgi:hypothetical protein